MTLQSTHTHLRMCIIASSPSKVTGFCAVVIKLIIKIFANQSSNYKSVDVILSCSFTVIVDVGASNE